MAETQTFVGDFVKLMSDATVIWTGTIRCIHGDSAQTIDTGLACVKSVFTSLTSSVALASSGITALSTIEDQTVAATRGHITIKVAGTGVAGSAQVTILALGQGSYT